MTTNHTAATAAVVREAIKRRGLTQVQVGVALGLSQQAVSDRLRGRSRLTVHDLERLAGLLEVPVSELLQPRAAA